MRYVCGNWIDVARQAQEPLFPAYQEHAVYTAVRRVADDAAFDFYGGMFKYERAALLDVALDARLPTGLAQRGTIGSAVGIVTVGAFHIALRDAVVGRQCELCEDVSMTGGTQVWLRFFKQTVGQPAGLFGNRGYGEERLLRRHRRIASWEG